MIGTVPHDSNALRKVFDSLGPRCQIVCCYETGPTGYGLAMAPIAAAWACDLIAPLLIPKKHGERIKTDRCDPVKLAQNYRSGELLTEFIPNEQGKAIRDLERAREDAQRQSNGRCSVELGLVC